MNLISNIFKEKEIEEFKSLAHKSYLHKSKGSGPQLDWWSYVHPRTPAYLGMPKTPVAGLPESLFSWEASILAKNPFFKWGQREAQGRQVSMMLCETRRLQGEGAPTKQAIWPKATLVCSFSTEQGTSRGRVLLEHVGANSPQCSIHWP